MKFRPFAYAACASLTGLVTLVASVACSSNSPSGGGGTVTCDAIAEVPATITVLSSTGAAIPCDATFTVLDEDDGGAPFLSCNASNGAQSGCPATSSDGGPTSCIYALSLGETGAHSIEVSQTGFQAQVVSGVSAGETGCGVATVPASHVTVTLVAN